MEAYCDKTWFTYIDTVKYQYGIYAVDAAQPCGVAYMREMSVDFSDLEKINLRLPMVPQVYDAMRRRIIELTWEPGRVLAKTEIAQALGVSQSPIREALLRLEQEGLVSIVPRSRTMVSLIDVQDAREAQFLRLSVEIQVLRTIAAAPDTNEGLWDLSMAVKRQEFFAGQGDMNEFVASDRTFHHTLFHLAGVDGLWDVVNSRRAHMDRLRQLDLPSRGKIDKVLKEHGEIIECLRRHDGDGAAEIIREHLRGTLERADRLQREFPQFFATSQETAS